MMLALVDQKPTAIGIDIDFSPPPEQYTYLTPDDEEFFQFCQNLTKQTKIPIFLGVNRRAVLPKQIWLASADWEELGAVITVPEKENRWMPAWIDSPNAQTMSAALSNNFRKSHCRSAEWFERFNLVRQISETRKGEDLTIGEFLVDYSAIDPLKEYQTMRTIQPETIRDQGHLFKGKMVLIGDATLGKATDLFVPPDRNQVVPGIFFHASAAYTLVRRPLYHITLPGRIVIDLLEAVGILLAILGIRLYFKRKTRKEVNTHRLEGAFTILIVLLAIFIGVLMVHKTCVVWSDFILAIAALVLHPSLEKRFDRLKERAGRTIPRITKWLLFDKGKEGHR
jgi:hypothetical protein